MALTSTVYNFDVSLSNVDRGVYESLKVQAAQHPSESIPYLLTRVLAYCLEYREGLSFSKGLSESEEPALWAHDLTGRLTDWIEVGAPSAARLHRARKLGARVVVYAHKDPLLLVAQLAKEEIFQAESIEIYGFETGFLDGLAERLERRNSLSLSVSDDHLYVVFAAASLESARTRYSITSGKPG